MDTQSSPPLSFREQLSPFVALMKGRTEHEGRDGDIGETSANQQLVFGLRITMHMYGTIGGKENQEYPFLVLEIWTDGSFPTAKVKL